ncbi:hypothetical protein [Streptomyces camelliae]|uniref:Secreted protein n=1 Tax=Streptomyces camelliae TaxID=3004093 RepID=A0ABY7P425_9ACTN|nr:hypothetical protein [Streptomyces sp. HUAS 2-6]WBO65271.1 hypothetical protein O1G22_21755 [Streptomyces sp. HUAS 2-6]
MLRTTTWTRGRRGAVTAASAVVVVLGGVVAACGGQGPGRGYVAAGAAGGPQSSGAAAAGPTGSVSFVPLDGAKGGNSPAPTPSSARPSSSDSPLPGSPEQTPPLLGTPSPSGSADGRTTPAPSGPGSPAPTPGSGTPDPTSGSGTPVGPADLSWGKPETAATDQRWCQKVTVGFHNSGGTAVRSGSVTFGTHIIGLLGIDWGTVDSTADLPGPIGPGAQVKPTWTVCVDAWRVPLGMHIETRDVSVRWK